MGRGQFGRWGVAVGGKWPGDGMLWLTSSSTAERFREVSLMRCSRGVLVQCKERLEHCHATLKVSTP